jgi:hypothetical protein
MHDEDMRSPAEQDNEIDAAVLALLLDERFDVWATVEVEREIGDAVATKDSLARLRGAGLIYELSHGFVMASRAARVADELPQ